MMWREGKREGGGRDERYGESEIEMWETLAGLAGWLLVGDLALPCLVRSQRPESRLRLVLTVRLSDPISLPALITGTPRAHGLIDDAHPSIPRVYPSRSTNLLTSPTLANKITIHSLPANPQFQHLRGPNQRNHPPSPPVCSRPLISIPHWPPIHKPRLKEKKKCAISHSHTKYFLKKIKYTIPMLLFHLLFFSTAAEAFCLPNTGGLRRGGGQLNLAL